MCWLIRVLQPMIPVLNNFLKPVSQLPDFVEPLLQLLQLLLCQGLNFTARERAPVARFEDARKLVDGKPDGKSATNQTNSLDHGSRVFSIPV